MSGFVGNLQVCARENRKDRVVDRDSVVLLFQTSEVIRCRFVVVFCDLGGWWVFWFEREIERGRGKIKVK
jgi:hypothetical protein